VLGEFSYAMMHVKMRYVGVEGCGIFGTLIRHGRGTGTGSREQRAHPGSPMTSFVHNLRSYSTFRFATFWKLKEANLLGSEQASV
jgi:hypothetical protein